MMDPITEFFDRLSTIDNPILTDLSGEARREVSGANLAGLLDHLAGSLADLGVESGDRIIVVCDNTLETALALLAAMRHGITVCLQPVGTPVEELQRLQTEVAAKTIVNAARDPMDLVPQILMEDLPASPTKRPPSIRPKTPFTITFTSGSTGAPKGIVHSAESFLECAKAFNEQTEITHEDRFLNVMPMFYMAGIFNGIIAPLSAGSSVVIGGAFDTSTAMRFWPLIAAEGISALWLSPAMLSLVVRLDRTDKTMPASMRRLFVGTGAMTSEDAANFHQMYGLPPLQSYGLSELLYISVDNAEVPSFGTVGSPIAGISLNCAEGQPLEISSPYAFLGYLVDGSLQPQEGPFLTSDLAKVSKDGVLSILGRADDIILRGGVNVNPADLEALLAPEMKSRNFCVIGLKDPTLGQKVVLVSEGAPLTSTVFAEVQKTVRAHPGRAQVDEAMQVATIPVGPTGKVRRAALREMLEGTGA